MAIGYTPQTWANGSAPPLSAANLQTMDNGINSACDALDTPATMAPIVATAIEAGTSTATPNDTDKLGGAKADHSLLYYTWANIKAAIKAYADTLYSDLSHQARHRIGGADALPAASDTVPGLVELATAAEVATGTDTGRSITPATLRTVFASDGGTTAYTAVQGSDSRLQSSPASWTPVPSFGGVVDDGTYVVSQNKYTVSGKKVHAEAKILWSVKGTKTGNFTLSVPVVAVPTSAIPCGRLVVLAGGASISVPITISISASLINVYFQGATALSNVTDVNFTASMDIRFSIDYIAA